MSAPVAEIRGAVRTALSALPVRPALVLVACSGGADSLALAAAVAFVAPRLRVRAGLVTVDHGLQPGSADRAAALARWAVGAGFAPVEVVAVEVEGRPGGPEAAAREARYEGLRAVAERHRAGAVLLGHTLDDQAETVLLALARGAGLRGVAGMPASRSWHGLAMLRPLLAIPRERARLACADLGLEAWVDPHNADPRYARARVRHTALPALVDALGPGVVANLARTATLAAADGRALDEWAGTALAQARDPDGGLPVAALVLLPDAVRTRVLHGWARELGAPGGALSHRHVDALDALVMAWHGQGATALPGGITVARVASRLVHTTPSGPEPDRR